MYTSNKNSANHLISAYNHMMLAIRHAFETEGDNNISLQTALFIAIDELVGKNELTLTDAYAISEYIKNDVNEAAEYMMETSEEFSDWLMLDIDIVERKVIDMFLSVADTTRREIQNFTHDSPKGIQ